MCQALFSKCFTNINSFMPSKDSQKKHSIGRMQKGQLRLREMKGSSRARVLKQAFPSPTMFSPALCLPQAKHLLEKEGVASIGIISHLLPGFVTHYLKYTLKK